MQCELEDKGESLRTWPLVEVEIVGVLGVVDKGVVEEVGLDGSEGSEKAVFGVLEESAGVFL